MGKLKLHEIVKILDATVIADTGNLEVEIEVACSADLMSDVLYYSIPNSLLITGLIKPQVIRTAEIAGIKIIVFVQNKNPDKNTIELAKQRRIPLLITPFCMYTASGKLFRAGLPGCSKK